MKRHEREGEGRKILEEVLDSIEDDDDEEEEKEKEGRGGGGDSSRGCAIIASTDQLRRTREKLAAEEIKF